VAVVANRVRRRVAFWRRVLADQGTRHPRQLFLVVVVVGLLHGTRAPASVVAAAALAVAFGSLTLPVVRRPAAALALAAALLGAAWVAEARTASLERTRLAASFGQSVTGEATVLSPLRADAFGGRRTLVRWHGEPVLMRVPSWMAPADERPALGGQALGGKASGARASSEHPSGGTPPDGEVDVDALRVGDIVSVRGRIRPPDLAGQALHAHATLRATELQATGRRRGGALGVVDGVRRRAERVLDGHLPPGEAALLRGMVLGDDAALPDDLRDAFKAASLTHLTAASGQNIALLAALALGLCIVAGVGIRARWTLVLALIVFYVPLAGGGPSIQRAGVMGVAAIAAALAGRPASRWYALLLAAAATLGLDPRAATDAGWQLSFAAVVGIATIAAPARDRLQRRGLAAPVAEAVSVTLAATLATAPLIAIHFDRVSLVALPANVLATLAVAPIMWLGLAAAALGQLVPSLASPLVALTGPLLGYLVGLARLAAGLPGAQVALPLSALVVLCALAAVLMTAPVTEMVAGPTHRLSPRDWLGPRRTPASSNGLSPQEWFAARGRPSATGGPRSGRRRALLAAAIFIAVAAALGPALIPPRTLAPPPAGTLRVTALGIGQGDATLLQAGGHAVLVDAGPAGDGIARKLKAAGVRRLDALVVTHPQADHDGGAPAVLMALPVAMLLDGRGGDRSPTSSAIDGPARRERTRVTPAQAGQLVRAGPLTLRILWPPAGPATPGVDPNDRAVVAVAEAFGATALLTADAESPVLAPLDIPPVDVLKVSHHGSADPGLPALLERLRPRVALIEVGAHNPYGHPTPSTLQALSAAVPVVKRTDRDGAVRVDLTAGQATVTNG
jgi:competence protein ComEC